MSELENTIKDFKVQLHDQHVCLPETVAVVEDYEVWGKEFAVRLVSNTRRFFMLTGPTNSQDAYDNVVGAIGAKTDEEVEVWVNDAREVLDGKDQAWLAWAGERLMPKTAAEVKAEEEEEAKRKRERLQAEREAEERRIAEKKEACEGNPKSSL
jgi:hypothetical protein